MSDTQWHWQERDTTWKGVGIYHITLIVPTREPLLGTLVIPNNDPSLAIVERTPLGEEVINCLMHLYEHYPEVRILQFCLMPDHLHVILHVFKTMPRGIMGVARGFWQATKKLGRAYSSHHNSTSSFPPNNIRGKEQSHPIFTQMPHIRPLVHQGQLQSMVQYVRMNPQRLATKRLMPGYFRVQAGIEIAGRKYSGVGNLALLQADRYAPVHVRRTMIDEAAHGDDKRLRDYMNGCVLAARQGAVMVSPFISEKEKEVMAVLLAEEHPIILLADNGFRNYYKPSVGLFNSVAAGKVLILSPWAYDPKKKHVSREDCIAMNAMAEEICQH